MNDKDIIKVQNLTYRYSKNIFANKKQKNILENVSFNIKQGYVYGVVGKNSTGKTTLLKILSGEFGRYEGTVSMECADTVIDYKNNIGIVTEDTEFFPHLGVLENAKILGALYEKFDEEKFRQYIADYGINELATLSTLSGGEQIKFQMAFALSYEPKVIIMDEPAGVLDAEAREGLINLVSLLATEKNMTVIMATHLTSDLDKMADYILFVNDDKSVTLCDRESLNDKYKILKGTEKQMENIPEKLLVSMEKSESMVTAMTDNYETIKQIAAQNDILAETPDIEDIMYFMEKRNKEQGKRIYNKNAERNDKKYSPKKRGNEGRNYKRFDRGYELLGYCSGNKLVGKISAFLLFAYWAWNILMREETEWWKDIILYLMLFMAVAMIENAFITPTKTDEKHIWKVFRCRPVSYKDLIKKLELRQLKGIAIMILIVIIVAVLEKGNPYIIDNTISLCGILIFTHMIDTVELWLVFTERRSHKILFGVEAKKNG